MPPIHGWTKSKPVGIYRGVIIPGFLRWIVSIQIDVKVTKGMTACQLEVAFRCFEQKPRRSHKRSCAPGCLHEMGRGAGFLICGMARKQ